MPSPFSDRVAFLIWKTKVSWFRVSQTNSAFVCVLWNLFPVYLVGGPCCSHLLPACISIKKKNSWDLWRLCLHHLHPLSTENSSHFGSLFSCFLFPFLPSFLPSSCNCSVGAQPRPKGSSLTPLLCTHPESNLSGNPLSSTTKAPPQELILSLQHRANSLGQADVVFLAWLLQPSWASLLLTCLAAVN